MGVKRVTVRRHISRAGIIAVAATSTFGGLAGIAEAKTNSNCKSAVHYLNYASERSVLSSSPAVRALWQGEIGPAEEKAAKACGW